MSWTRWVMWVCVAVGILGLGLGVQAQETTGGLQGTVKDPTGAVVAGAHIVLNGSSLVGTKETDTDASGYYHFSNLPPGTYAVTVTATGFSTLKQGNIDIGIGRLPTIDFALQLGAVTSTIEVTSAPPMIDTTSTVNQTNLSEQSLQNLPTGYSYQSVIQLAPMARNEPLAGYTVMGRGSGGTGGSMPGSSGNGLTFGYSIGGAADSENSYLIEGQDTEQLSGGYSNANVPFQFIQEVNLKTSGIQAEYGGALGGVVNVVMRKGSNAYHGSLFTTYESNKLDANDNNIFLRYDPNDTGNADLGIDPAPQLYNPSKDHTKTVQPGFTIGGPLKKDRLWFFAGFAPEFYTLAKNVNFNSKTNFEGLQYFTRDRQTYYTNLRLDAALTQRIRLYASWLDQYARETGASMPTSDPVKAESSFLNPDINTPLSNFSHGLGWAAPNATYNFGADITLSHSIVATTRYGYFFDNYHDFGWQTQVPNLEWVASGVGATDNAGNALPTALQQPGGTTTAAYTQTFTPVNANKHYQFNQDVAFIKSGWWGTHNFKMGYQLNKLENVISQNGNVPLVLMYPGAGTKYSPSTTTGVNNCAALAAKWGVCAGQYGYVTVQDFATVLTVPAVDWNHALYAEDSWTTGHNLTLNVGIRVEKESLPAPGGVKVPGINFSWTDKVAPRLGAAWDPTGRGKMKIFASYGVVNDVMKLLLAQTSFGAQAYEDCTYAMGPNGSGTFDPASIDAVFKNGRACPSGATTLGANWASGNTPASLTDAATGVSLIENVNFRPAEPVAPGVKPYRQHEYTFGWDYSISPTLAFEARYDRRRLDHVIEDASLSDKVWGETYAVVNPGQGVNSTIDGYANYLTSLGQSFLVPGWAFNDTADYGAGAAFGTCPSCPPLPKAIRNYDGLEFRLSKSMSKNWSGSFSYTYSRLWGNYTGLTTTDQSDGNAAGRNSPDTTRAFDEPFMYFGANGKSNDGVLPTDRPNTFKFDAYYQVPWKNMSTTFGIFQYDYQGTPMSSYTDLAASTAQIPYESVYIFGRGMWSNITTDADGNMTFGTPYARRTPWFTQTDLSISHQFNVTEGRSLRFEANITNLFNQHAVVQYYQGFNSINFETPLRPNGITLSDGASLYQTLETGYNPQAWVGGGNCASVGGTSCTPPAVIKSSWYGQPQQYQLLRRIRLGVTFSF